MAELGRFQARFAQALRAATAAPPGLDPLALGLYRNTVARGLTGALRAGFPTVERIAGEAWFAACADLFARQAPPSGPVLATYGEGFAGFLDTFAPAGAMPYLADVARIDRMWSLSHVAADEAALSGARLAGLGPETLLETPVRLHAAAQVAWFDGPVPSLWLANRPPAPVCEGFDLSGPPEGIAFARPDGAVQPLLLDGPRHAFLAACRRPATLGEAIARTLESFPAADPAEALGAVLAHGLIASDPPSNDQETRP